MAKSPDRVDTVSEGDVLVKGKRYTITWGAAERLPSDLILDGRAM